MPNTATTAEPTAAELERTGSRLDAAGGLAANTVAAYESRLIQLDAWLSDRLLDDEALALHLAWLHAKGLCYSTANQTVCAVQWRAERAGDASPVGRKTRRRLVGFRRVDAGRRSQQVDGLSWEQAEAACRQAEACANVRGWRDAALIGVASDCLLRVSEVSALTVKDVSFMPDGSARLAVRRSKTDREGAGVIQFLGATNAVRLARWMEAESLTAGPLFRPIDRYGRVGKARLGPASVREAIKDRAAAAGVPGRISGHSPRVGSVQSLAEHDASFAQIMKDGRWKTAAMVALYLGSQDAAKSGVARLRHGATAGGRKKMKKVLAPPKEGVLGCH